MGYVGIEKDRYVSLKKVLDITAETGALETQSRIRKLPYEDVTPVVHAYWIRHENADVFEGYEVPMFECSNCKTWKEDDSDFCPDCGADMRGERMDAYIRRQAAIDTFCKMIPSLGR